MALNYRDVHRFVKKNGKVTMVASKRAKITLLLQSGEIDSVALVEKDATHFIHGGKTYSRKEFEKLVLGE